MLLCIFAKYQTLDLLKYFNNEIMLTHENSFYINEGKNTTQVAYKITWQQRENWKYVLPVQILASYFTRSNITFEFYTLFNFDFISNVVIKFITNDCILTQLI